MPLHKKKNFYMRRDRPELKSKSNSGMFCKPRCKYGRALSFTLCISCTIIIELLAVNLLKKANSAWCKNCELCPMLCILTCFCVLHGPISWLKHFFILLKKETLFFRSFLKFFLDFSQQITENCFI